MIVTQKVKLYPNKETKKQLDELIDLDAYLYQWAIYVSEHNYRRVERITIDKLINLFYKLDAHVKYRDIPETIMKNSFREGLHYFYYMLEKKALKKIVKTRHTKGFTLNSNDFYAYNVKNKSKYGFLKMSNIKKIPFRRKLRFNSYISTIHVLKENDKYYATIVFIVGENKYRDSIKAITVNKPTLIGIDLTFDNRIIFSNGMKVEIPQEKLSSITKSIYKLRAKLRNKQVKSLNYQKCEKNIREKIIKILNINSSYQQLVTNLISKNYKYVVLRSLDINEMNKRRNYVIRNFFGSAFFDIKKILQRKVHFRNGNLILSSKNCFSTNHCCRCGCLFEDKDLFGDYYHCSNCNLFIDKEINRAKILTSSFLKAHKLSKKSFVTADINVFNVLIASKSAKYSNVTLDFTKNMTQEVLT